MSVITYTYSSAHCAVRMSVITRDNLTQVFHYTKLQYVVTELKNINILNITRPCNAIRYIWYRISFYNEGNASSDINVMLTILRLIRGKN